MRTAPSLRGLAAVEAAARTGSFAAAAEELGVTPAAVSQLVRTLEDQIGRQLFLRVNRGIALTEAGLEIVPRLTAAFEELRGVTRQLSGRGPRARLIVSAPPSVASGWLALRIADFIAESGQIDISLRGEDDPVPFERELIDVRLSLGRYQYQAHEGEALCTDSVYPVCAQGLLEKLRPMERVEDLLDAPLIHTDWGPAGATFPPWRTWFGESPAVAGSRVARGIVANSSQAAIELASCGLGVALAQGLLAAGRIESGALIRPVPQSLPLAQPYVMTIPARSLQRPLVQSFAGWMRREIARTVGSLRADDVAVSV